MRPWSTYLELNLSLSNVLLAATTIGNLLDLGNLGLDSLQLKDWVKKYIKAFSSFPQLTSALKSSRGYASTALMLRAESG
jgi:hypothetical protein